MYGLLHKSSKEDESCARSNSELKGFASLRDQFSPPTFVLSTLSLNNKDMYKQVMQSLGSFLFETVVWDLYEAASWLQVYYARLGLGDDPAASQAASLTHEENAGDLSKNDTRDRKEAKR